MTQSIYEDIALLFVTKDNYADLIEQLRDGGLRKLLRNDRDLSEALIVAGVCVQLVPTRGSIEVTLEGVGLDSRLFDELVKMGQCGFDLALTDGKFAVILV